MSGDRRKGDEVRSKEREKEKKKNEGMKRGGDVGVKENIHFFW